MGLQKSRLVLDEPTPELVQEYINKFNNEDRFKASDDVILKLMEVAKENKNFEEVFLKVVTINALYSTNIFDTYKLARHIHNNIDNLDEKLQEGDIGVVNEIAKGHGIERKGKQLYFYSFATKYCSWHNLDAYPIYDSYVEKVLLSYKRQYKFSEFRADDLRDFQIFKRVLDDFRHKFHLQNFSIKEIDKFLWLYGKEKF